MESHPGSCKYGLTHAEDVSLTRSALSLMVAGLSSGSMANFLPLNETVLLSERSFLDPSLGPWKLDVPFRIQSNEPSICFFALASTGPDWIRFSRAPVLLHHR